MRTILTLAVQFLGVLWIAGNASAEAPRKEPSLTPIDVRNAADNSTGGVAAGEVVVLLVSNAGPAEMVPWGQAANLGETTDIGETRVFFDNVPVPVIYTVDGRIGTVVPSAVASKKSTTVIVEYRGKRSAPVTLTVVPSSPAIFTLDGSGKGPAAMLNETGCCNSVRNPALLGSVVSLYATGEGKLASGRTGEELAVTVGGIPAPIVFTKNEGSLQVDFRIPENATTGDDVPLVLSVRGKPSAKGVTMAVRSPRSRIVVAHQDAATRGAIARTLEAAGFQVIESRESQQDGFRPPEKVDLLVLDIVMAAEKALALIAGIKETSPQLRILAITPNLDPAVLKDADLLGAQSVVSRPFDGAKLVGSARTLLRKKSAVY